MREFARRNRVVAKGVDFTNTRNAPKGVTFDTEGNILKIRSTIGNIRKAKGFDYSVA